MSPTGKVDRKALPAPQTTRSSASSEFVAPRNELERRLCAIWSELLKVARVGIHDDFFALGGHSLMVSRVSFRIQDALGLEIPMRAIYEAPTIAAISALVEDLRHTPSAQALCYTPTLVLSEEAQLDPRIRPAPESVDVTRPPERIFLTGATGFVGSHLLSEMLSTTAAQVHCLVRARSAAEGMARLEASLDKYGLRSDLLPGRVQIVLGDLGASRFGLSPLAFDQLGASIDSIWHNGAKVDHVRGYDHMKAANVFGTHEVLRLAASGRTKPVHFVSTLGVIHPFDYAQAGVVSESAPADALARLPNGYMQTKCVAERLITLALERGMPAAIYRLGAVTGHSATGDCNPSDFTYSALRSTIELGFADNLDTDLTLSPIDFVARALVALMSSPNTLGKTHHVTNPHAFGWLELIAELNQRGYDIRVVSYAECMQGLLDAARRGVDTPMLAFLPFVTQRVPGSARYVAEDYNARVRWSCSNMLTVLEQRGCPLPPRPQEILSTYLTYLERRGLLPSPHHAGQKGQTRAEHDQNDAGVVRTFQAP